MADWTPVGEWGVSAFRLVVVPFLRPVLSSLSPGRAVPRLPSAREGARCSSLLLWWGELILGSRLGSLTQIRHDKEGESGTCAEAQAWAESGGVNSADGRICASKSRSAGLRFTQLYVLRWLRVKWVRRALCNIEARPWNTSYSMRNRLHFPLVTEGLRRETFVLVLGNFSLEAALT